MITFDKLKILMQERHMSLYKLKTDKIIGSATLDKIRDNTGHIDTRSINSICNYLQCQPGDIMSWVPDTHQSDD